MQQRLPNTGSFNRYSTKSMRTYEEPAYVFPSYPQAARYPQDCEEPGRQVRPGLEAIMGTKGPNHRLLEQIVGLVDVRSQGDRERAQRGDRLQEVCAEAHVRVSHGLTPTVSFRDG